MSKHRFPYKWQKGELDRVQKHGHTVFSTFSCGGGSSFGYKMAGFDVIGCNEIDKEMVAFYRANHHPLYVYNEPIQTFKNREDLPPELFNLDILDGSPPCSTFSMSGSREDAWGKEKKFREGQAEQVLSDLFFDYLDLVAKLKPKVSIAENVSGMVLGKAKGYCKMVIEQYNKLGYDVQLYLMNSSRMGVPQKRERVFFIARRRDLNWPNLTLAFGEDPITFREVTEALPFQDLEGTAGCKTDSIFWGIVPPGKSYCTISRKNNYFNTAKLKMTGVSPTIVASKSNVHPTEKRLLSWVETCLIGSYPYDYDFLGKNSAMKLYLIGMSVPPVMTAQIAAKVAEQWFNVPSEQIDAAWEVKK